MQIFHIDRRKPSDLEPAYIIDSVRDLCDRLVVVRGDSLLSKEAQQNETLLFHMLLRATFATRRVLERYHLNREAFEWVRGEVEAKFNPDVTLGVPRLKEIMNVATNIKTPSLNIYLEDDIAKNAMMVKNMQQELTFTSLLTITVADEEVEQKLHPVSLGCCTSNWTVPRRWVAS
uniref:Arg-6 protein n=1 Tax=Ganoderma boninense TaxID=34458 RepID=A0A5K1K5R1_9APHY|nr:Arg-6 protein [Ganoderma boninense]